MDYCNCLLVCSRSSTYLRQWTIRPHHRRFDQPSLLTCSTADHRCLDISSSSRHCVTSPGVANVTTTSRVNMASTDQRTVPKYRLSTVVERAFPAAGARMWNGLPADMTSVPLLTSSKLHYSSDSGPGNIYNI